MTNCKPVSCSRRTLHHGVSKCDVPSIAVFCSESIECFPSIASKFFLKLLLLIILLLLLCIIIIIIIIIIEGNRELDRDHEHCKPKGKKDEEKQSYMVKKIRRGAKEKNVRGRKTLRTASNCVGRTFKGNGSLVLRGSFSCHLASR